MLLKSLKYSLQVKYILHVNKTPLITYPLHVNEIFEFSTFNTERISMVIVRMRK